WRRPHVRPPFPCALAEVARDMRLEADEGDAGRNAEVDRERVACQVIAKAGDIAAVDRDHDDDRPPGVEQVADRVEALPGGDHAYRVDDSKPGRGRTRTHPEQPHVPV